MVHHTAMALLLAALSPSLLLAGRVTGGSNDLPVTKVVKLLEAMGKDLEKEMKEDEATFKRLQCWCDTNNKLKNQAVEDAKTAIDQLEAKVETASGRTGVLSTEITQTKDDIVETEKALAEATAIRKKEAAAFHDQEKEMIAAVKLLHGAITALEKHHPDKTGLIQSTETELASLRPSLRRLVHRNAKLFGWLRNSVAKKDVLLKFIDANPDILDPDDVPTPSFIQQRQLRASTVPFFKSYTPQSGQIFGILRQMKEDFEADLPQIQQEEASKVTAFAEMKGAKEAQLKQMKQDIKDKTAELAATKETLATARSDLEDTRAQMSADQKTLLMIQERCQEGNFEWERRSKMRAEEIEAVSQAIAILTADGVKDGQQTNWGAGTGQAPEVQEPPAFLQVAGKDDQWRGRVSQILTRASSKVTLGAKDLALLAALSQTGPFEKVLKAIDELIVKLKAEMDDEVKQQDFCVNSLNENEVVTARTNHTLERLEAQLEALKSDAKEIETTIQNLKDEIASMQVELQRASQGRIEENLQFQTVVKDQKVLVEALNAAHEKLAGFYMQHETFLQKQEPDAEPKGSMWNPGHQDVSDAPEFQDYHTHGNSNHVLTLLEKLQGEAKVLLDASHHDEQEAQIAYEALVTDTNVQVKANTRSIADKTEELANVKEQIDKTAADRERTIKELEALGEEKIALHTQCDFLMNNFGLRQDSRAQEIEALGEVKAILGGMKSE